MIREAKILLLAMVGCALILLCPTMHCQSCITNAQVTLTGNLRSANGIPSSNSILTLTPSQQGLIAGCGVNLATVNTCATSIDGSVVGIQNPQTATVNTTSGSGSLPPTVYYTVYEWYDVVGHVTLASPETITTLDGYGSLVVNPPSSGVPSLAVGMDVFIGVTSGGETLQGQTVGSASFVQSSALTSGISPASTNTTLCKVVANDAVWPTGTGYNVSMVTVNGNPVPNYPMQWQLLGPGSTYNLSNGLPYYHGVVFYPVPILSQPANHGQQSISGPLNFGGYNVTGVGKLGVGTNFPGWGIDVEGSGPSSYINGTAFLIGGAGGTSGQYPCSDGIAIDHFCSSASGFYQTIASNGTAQTQRPTLNFSPAFSVTDSSSPAQTTIGINKVVITLPTSTIAGNTCIPSSSTFYSATLIGVVPGATFSTSFNGNPNAVVGWGATGGLVVNLWPDPTTPNQLDWSVCNQSTGSITPGAISLNVGVN